MHAVTESISILYPSLTICLFGLLPGIQEAKIYVLNLSQNELLYVPQVS